MASRSVSSQAPLSELLQVNQSAVSKRLRGVTLFDANELAIIAAFFQITVIQFVAETERPRPANPDGDNGVLPHEFQPGTPPVTSVDSCSWSPEVNPPSAYRVNLSSSGNEARPRRDREIPMYLVQYRTYLRAAGMRPLTVKLRLYYLDRAQEALGELTCLTSYELLDWLSSHEWSPETRKSARASLRGFYRGEVDNELVTVDPTVRLPSDRVPLGTPRPTPSRVLREALMAASDRDRLLLALAAYAGLRRSEIATLPWSAVEWSGLRICGKGGRTRVVPLAPPLLADLVDERRRREAGTCGTGWRYKVDPCSDYVFPGLKGGQMSPETVGATLTRLLGGAWSGHTLRTDSRPRPTPSSVTC